MKQLYICEKCGGNGYLQIKGSGVGGFKRCPVCGGRGEVEESPNPVAKAVETPAEEKPVKKTRRKKADAESQS